MLYFNLICKNENIILEDAYGNNFNKSQKFIYCIQIDIVKNFTMHVYNNTHRKINNGIWCKFQCYTNKTIYNKSDI